MPTEQKKGRKPKESKAPELKKKKSQIKAKAKKLAKPIIRERIDLTGILNPEAEPGENMLKEHRLVYTLSEGKEIYIIEVTKDSLTYLDLDEKTKKSQPCVYKNRYYFNYQMMPRKAGEEDTKTMRIYLDECKAKKIRSLMGSYKLLFNITKTAVIEIIAATDIYVTYNDVDGTQRKSRTNKSADGRIFFTYSNDKNQKNIYFDKCKRKKIITEAQKSATKKYVYNHYETIATIVPKGAKNIIREEASKKGLSLNRFVKDAIVEKAKNSELKEILAVKGND